MQSHHKCTRIREMYFRMIHTSRLKQNRQQLIVTSSDFLQQSFISVQQLHGILASSKRKKTFSLCDWTSTSHSKKEKRIKILAVRVKTSSYSSAKEANWSGHHLTGFKGSNSEAFSFHSPNSDLRYLQLGCLPSITSILPHSRLMSDENSISGTTTLWIIPPLHALAAD